MTTIAIHQIRHYLDTVAVVERDEAGQIIWCNHDQGTEWEDVGAPEFDPDSKQYIMTGTARIETCGKCHAEFNNITEEWEEIPAW